jgi:hypothetical protein
MKVWHKNFTWDSIEIHIPNESFKIFKQNLGGQYLHSDNLFVHSPFESVHSLIAGIVFSNIAIYLQIFFSPAIKQHPA